jgi:hypothetical protein
VVIE